MCKRCELDDSCSIDRTTTSYKGKRRCQRQSQTAEDQVDRCYFMTESDRELRNPQDPLILRIRFYLFSFLIVIYKAERKIAQLVLKFTVYNYSFGHIILLLW